jgi:cell division septum initiation protein DivIVA
MSGKRNEIDNEIHVLSTENKSLKERIKSLEEEGKHSY